MNLIPAIKELRQRLGESQQAFATRLGISIRALANYEKDRQPHGKVLAALARAAEQGGQKPLADIFHRGLMADLRFDPFTHRGTVYLGRGWGYLVQRVENQEEQVYLLAFHNAMHNLRSTDLAIQEASRAALKEFAARMEPEKEKSK